MSEWALLQAAELRAVEEKTTHEVIQVLLARAEEAQHKIQSVTQVTMQTQRDVQGLSTIASYSKGSVGDETNGEKGRRRKIPIGARDTRSKICTRNNCSTIGKSAKGGIIFDVNVPIV